MSRILVTGATGFVGRHLLRRLAERADDEVVAVVRPAHGGLEGDVSKVRRMEITPHTDWSAALDGIDCIVHLAWVMTATGAAGDEPGSGAQQRNVEGALNLARQAAGRAVRRFIFISSAKVHGAVSERLHPFIRDDVPKPEDAYAASKLAAERELQAWSTGTSMEVVVIRPPLVYGPGVKANFRSLLAWTNRGVPLPLGALHNQRSLVAIGNLVDLIVVCVRHPHAAGQVFLVSDGEDVSTTELLRRIARALGRPSRLLPFPAWSLTLAASLLGKGAVAKRLCGNLQVDIAYTRETLDWRPSVTIDQALQETAQAYLAEPSTPSERGESSRLLRVFDVVFSLLGLLCGSPVLLVLTVLGWFGTGSPLFRQVRVGRGKRPFTLVKFRTMRRDTASVASHLADQSAITPLGRVMRKAKLDELPQLWNVLKGDMSLVGPRPGLYNQHELTTARDELGVYRARPGITGLAQIKHIDMSTPVLLAQTDHEMLRSLSPGTYLKYLIRTVSGQGSGDAVPRP